MIRNGHRREAIPHYTRRQIALFHGEAMALEAAARADRIEDIGAAFSEESARLCDLLRGN